VVNATPRPFYPPGRTRYPLYRTLDGPRAGLDGCGKFRPPPEFDPRTTFKDVSSRYCGTDRSSSRAWGELSVLLLVCVQQLLNSLWPLCETQNVSCLSWPTNVNLSREQHIKNIINFSTFNPNKYNYSHLRKPHPSGDPCGTSRMNSYSVNEHVLFFIPPNKISDLSRSCPMPDQKYDRLEYPLGLFSSISSTIVRLAVINPTGHISSGECLLGKTKFLACCVTPKILDHFHKVPPLLRTHPPVLFR